MPVPRHLAALALALGAALAHPVMAAPLAAEPATYANPLALAGPGGAPVDSCADPTVERLPGDPPAWAMLCTGDPLSGADRDAGGDLVFHLLPMFRSPDLVAWGYAGDAFDRDPATPTLPPPAWAEPTAGFWAPEIDLVEGRWVLLFAVTDVVEAAGGEPGCDWDPAIGLATAPTPFGPWAAAPEPLVAPRRSGPGCDFEATIDPELIEAEDGRRVLYYGSFGGGIEARPVVAGADGRWAAPAAAAVPVAGPGRYEGAEVIRRDGFYHLLLSSGACCAGPDTGYDVVDARARDPYGPFLDRDGAALTGPLPGGTPVLAQDGRRWVGPGHPTVLRDEAGAWWAIYHAVEEAAPYFAGAPGFTRRPVLLDRLDWIDGWPAVDAGDGPSEGPRPAPALRPGPVAPVPPPPPERLGAPVAALSDAFGGERLDRRWSWLRGPPASVALGGTLRLAVHGGGLRVGHATAPVLVEPAPEGDFAVEVRVRTDAALGACCHDGLRAGLVVLGAGDRAVSLALGLDGETRLTLLAREAGPSAHGESLVGPAGADWTWLRLTVRRDPPGPARVAAATSRDGVAWARGGAWALPLGARPRLGLVAMGGAAVTAEFDDLTVRPLGP